MSLFAVKREDPARIWASARIPVLIQSGWTGWSVAAARTHWRNVDTKAGAHTTAITRKTWSSRALKVCTRTARVTIRPGFPGHVLFSGVFEYRRFVRLFGPIRKYIRTLPIAKAYDGMRQRKLLSFQYKMSVASQKAILVQASCTV